MAPWRKPYKPRATSMDCGEARHQLKWWLMEKWRNSGSKSMSPLNPAHRLLPSSLMLGPVLVSSNGRIRNKPPHTRIVVKQAHRVGRPCGVTVDSSLEYPLPGAVSSQGRLPVPPLATRAMIFPRQWSRPMTVPKATRPCPHSYPMVCCSSVIVISRASLE